MQRFELAAGASAKFWEIERQGATVTVRFGRIGAAGQRQAKTFATAAAAGAHEAKLIAEKTGKGYLQVSSMALTAAAENPPAPDESRLVLPAEWRAGAWPRRDRDPAPAVSLPPGRERQVLEMHEISLRSWLANAATVAGLSNAGLAYLDARLRDVDGPGDPLGAAVCVTAVVFAVSFHHNEEQLVPVVDDWVGRLGYGFAAAAVAELSGLGITGGRSRVHTDVGVVPIASAGPPVLYLPAWLPLALRLRALLAVAGDADRSAAVAALDGYRAGPSPHHRATASFLVPDRYDWVAADFAALASSADVTVALLLGGAAHTAEQVRAVADAGRLHTAAAVPPLLATLVTAVGAPLAPVLDEWLDRYANHPDSTKRLLTALSFLPSDEALRLLLRRAGGKYTHAAVSDALARFPNRALRLLAGAPGGDRTAAALLRVHVLSHRDAARQTLPTLPTTAAERVRAILDAAGSTSVAPPAAVPAILTDPPWTRGRKATKRVVVAGLTATPEAAMAWKPGEREAFLARKAEITDWSRHNHTWADLAATDLDRRTHNPWREIPIMVHAPDEITRPALAGWVPRTTRDFEAAASPLVGRYELDVLRAILAMARELRWKILPALLPYASSEVATLVADWHERKSVRAAAAHWLVRHPGVTARALVPAAVGPAGAARRQAERALRVVAQAGHRADVLAAADAHGPAVVGAITALLDTDPLDVLPPKPPAVPDWLDPALMPAVLLASGAGALPADAVQHLCTVFALSTVAEPYAGVAPVVAACDPESLAGFWWEAFIRWQQAGYPPAAGWVLQALGLVGDDETVRRLAPLIRAWPADGGHSRAVAGLDVLAAIGTDMALLHLNGIATRVKFAGLRERAREKIDEVADGLGLTAEQLADRLVPDLGLDADGSLVLAVGPRSFTVGFDERLKPHVVDQDGNWRAALPKGDPAADKRFAALKKDVRAVAADQVRRLEKAMTTGRTWTGAQFRVLVVAHPLLVHLVRRLVWTADGAAFRVAEDRTFADADDTPFTLADDAVVGVAHPVVLGPATKAWATVFADYAILQPFPQLDRATFTLTDEEAAGNRLTRWAGRSVPATDVLRLERRGWVRGEIQDGGVHCWFELPVGGHTVVAGIDPGIVAGNPTLLGDQTIGEVFLRRPTDPWSTTSHDGAPFGTLDRITASEVLRDLTDVAP